jgi:hypothetical protein
MTTDDTPRWAITADDVKDGPIRTLVEGWLEDWVTMIRPGWTYDDLMDRLDGTTFYGPDGPVILDLPDSTDHPTYKALVRLARRVRAESQ